MITKNFKQQKNKDKEDLQLEEFEEKQLTGILGELPHLGYIGFAIITLILMLYTIGLVVFTFTVPPGTIVNSINISGEKYSDLDEVLQIEEPTTPFLVIEHDGSEIVRVNYGEVEGSKAVDVKIQFNEFLWFIEIFRHRSIETKVTYTYDAVKLKDKLEKINKMLEPPADSELKKVDGKYIVTDEQLGDKININEVLTRINNAEYVGDILYFNADVNPEILQQPKSLKDNKILVTQYEFYRSIIERRPYIALTADITYRLDEMELCSLIEFDFTKKMITVDSDAVTEFVGDLYDRYYTVGTEQKFLDHEGNVKAITGGAYGWELDKETTTERIIATLETLNEISNTEQPSVIKVQWLSKGHTDGKQLLAKYEGNRYILVSLEDQHVWVKDGDKVVMESDCVTGTENKNDTPTGTFSVIERKAGKYLTGDNYKTWVNKWMRLTWSGIGFHDAKWRGSFGGKIYKTNGSHGCINLPSKFANTLFDWIETGDVVFIY